VRDAVASAGGAITIDSAPGRGTVVDIYLPLAEQAATRLPWLRPAALAGDAARAPEQTVPVALIADDEPALRDLLDKLLIRLGFMVVLASDGASALAKTSEMNRLDLVVCDLHMPQMDGLELGRRVRNTHPGAAILLLTGAPPAAAVADRNLRILRKPFEWRDLRDVVLQLVPVASDPAELDTRSPAV
jgi:CheY-like chemotaxis protein